jgi:DNA (cytosine-5)-methyltransferase 1
MLFGSVCSGIEAATVAFAPLGWRAAWFSEIESFPSAVLKHHYPDVRNLGDMRGVAAMIDAGQIESPDVLCGGTPCQSFSVAGLRKSLDDDRGNLTLEFIRIADAIDRVRRDSGRPPAYILWENVPGVLSTTDNAFGTFLGGLCGGSAALDRPDGGWPTAGVVAGPSRVVAWRVLDAQFFGLAQRRRRVFVLALGGAGNWRCADALLPISDSMSWDPAPSREAGKRSAGSLTASAARRGGVDEGERGNLVAFGGNNTAGPIDVATACRAKGGTGHGDFESETFIASREPQEPYTLAIRGRQGHSDLEFHQDGIANAILTPSGGRAGMGVGAIAVDYTNISLGDDLSGTIEASQDKKNRGHGVLAFDTTQVTSKGNVSNPQPGDPCHPLAAGAHPPAIAFDCKTSGQSGFGVGEEVTSTLRAMSHADGNQNGGGQLAVAQPPAFAFKASHFTRDKDGAPSDIAPPLSADADKGDQDPLLMDRWRVRRLTPGECEALQGFPRDHTAITYRGRPAMDGPRYRALGNSWAVPVVAYIGRRIAEVEAKHREASEP